MMDKSHTTIPLCHPDNFEWDSGTGTLVEKRTKRGKLVVCEDALEILRSIDGPICPIAVTGPARCGKSYIASQMVEPRPHDCVFQTSNNMLPQTMGIWMSTDVFKKEWRKGIEMTVVVMDTEGLDAYDAYSKDDLQMFSLMSLLASVLVYNSRGAITANDIKKLSWVGTLGNVIKVDEARRATKSQVKDFIKFFPNFMWLLRDVSMTFSISRGDEEIEVDIKHYILEEVLKLEDETDDGDGRVKEKNRYRKALLKSFPVFDAFKLSTPSIDKDVLANMHKGETSSKLEESFLTEVDGLLDRLAILMKPKKAWPYVGNINGKQFAELLKEYVSEFSSSDGVLNIHTVGSKVVETLLNDVQEKAFDKYTSKMDEFLKSALPCPNHEIIYKHKDCLDQAKKYFKVKSKYIKDFCSLKTQRKKLLEKTAVYSDDGRTCVGGHLKTSLASNVKESDAFCRKIADDLFKEKLRPLMDSYENGDSLQSIDVDLVINDVEREYKKRARGPQMWQVYKTELAEEISMFATSVSKSGAGNSSEKLEVMKAEEEEKKDQENVEKQMLNLKTNEEKTMRLTIKEDIVEQQKELANDLEESTAAILSQVSQLLQSHPGLAKELQILTAKLEEESKTQEKELIKEKDCMA